MCSFLCPPQRSGAYSFCPVCLSFCLFVRKNFNIGHNFWMVSDTAFILHMCISWVKMFSLVSRSRYLSRSNIKVTIFYKWALWVDSCFTNTSFFFFVTDFACKNCVVGQASLPNPLTHYSNFEGPLRKRFLQTQLEKDEMTVVVFSPFH